LGQDKNAIGIWFKELEHYGFVVMVQGAHLGAEGKGKSATYRLTDRYHAGKPPTYDFQSWDGALFEPKKRIDKRGTSRLHALQKQNPVRTPRTECPYPTDIRNDAECPHPTDISSSPSTEPASTPPKLPWTTSQLVEITDRLSRETLAGLMALRLIDDSPMAMAA
jgi:hypothetical protein